MEMTATLHFFVLLRYVGNTLKHVLCFWTNPCFLYQYGSFDIAKTDSVCLSRCKLFRREGLEKKHARGQRDSNRRPRVRKADALLNELCFTMNYELTSNPWLLIFVFVLDLQKLCLLGKRFYWLLVWIA